MFEDRSNGYDFKKIDQNARIQTITESKKDYSNKPSAYSKLFSNQKIEQEKKEEPVLNKQHNLNINSLPSSSYLQSFQNQTIDNIQQESLKSSEIVETKQNDTEISEKTTKVEDYINLLDSETETNKKQIQKELKSITPAPKKNYSFRIKLVAGVYCVLVALFGGWVIGNAINIAHTNSNIHNIQTQKEEISADIGKIVLKIQNFDAASQNPEDQNVFVEISTELIEVTPEPVEQPNTYQQQSNWFDKLCNWLARLFGGR